MPGSGTLLAEFSLVPVSTIDPTCAPVLSDTATAAPTNGSSASSVIDDPEFEQIVKIYSIPNLVLPSSIATPCKWPNYCNYYSFHKISSFKSAQQQPTEYPMQSLYSGVGRTQLSVQVMTPASEVERGRSVTLIFPFKLHANLSDKDDLYQVAVRTCPNGEIMEGPFVADSANSRFPNLRLLNNCSTPYS